MAPTQTIDHPRQRFATRTPVLIPMRTKHAVYDLHSSRRQRREYLSMKFLSFFKCDQSARHTALIRNDE